VFPSSCIHSIEVPPLCPTTESSVKRAAAYLNGPGSPEVDARTFLLVYRVTSRSGDSVVITVTEMAWSLYRMVWGLTAEVLWLSSQLEQ
jgi:hypothetical protein